MSLPIFLLCFIITIPHLFIIIVSQTDSPIPGNSYVINCGGSGGTTESGVKYVSDEGFVSSGGATAAVRQHDEVIPLLATVRYFPDAAARKHCVAVPAAKGGKYLVRTTYFYGGFDGGDAPPVFEQVVDGTRWGVVDTAEDYAAGLSSYYEVVVVAAGRELSVCVARSERTAAAASPFISAVEVERVEDSLYNATDFGRFALSTVARSNFGGDADFFGFPDDKFNRIWQSFNDSNPIVRSHSNVTPSDFWNLPPARAFSTGLTTSRGKALQLRWPPGPLSGGGADYHVALYFQDNRTPSPFSWRVFNVSLNGQNFYSNLNVTADGVAVYSPLWPLFGQTVIKLTPAEGSPVGPVINAGEILQILPLGGRTISSDEMAMVELARSFTNPPSDWTGDPCLPEKNSWTGVTCSKQGNSARVIALNLNGKGLSGTLPQSIANLTALNHIWLGGNKLSGIIPEMWSLKELKTLHLENNQFEGPIPKSLGQLPSLYEIFLQNNKLNGEIPTALRNQNGKTIKV